MRLLPRLPSRVSRPCLTRLSRVLASTLATLGLPSLQAALLQQTAILGQTNLEDADAAPDWMAIASALLRIESSLDDALLRAANRDRAPIDQATPAIRELAEASRAIKEAAQSAQSMVSKLEGPTSDFAATGLPQLSAAIVTLQQASESLDRLTSEVERNPRGLIGKGPAKQVEVKP